MDDMPETIRSIGDVPGKAVCPTCGQGVDGWEHKPGYVLTAD
jgi:hypothetical protein